MANVDYTLERLEDQISWYDKNSTKNKNRYQRLEVIEIVVASVIPFLAAANAPSLITGLAGVIIVVIEGLQHIFQFHSNWLNYRSTCESLRHEKALFLATAGPYGEDEDPQKLLAERIESLISQENSKWVIGQEQTKKNKKS